MADYYGKTLSNSVGVKDIDAYIELVESIPSSNIIIFGRDIDDSSKAMFSCDGIIDLQSDDDDLKVITSIQKLLLDDEILVVKEIGSEKLNSLDASAFLISNKDVKFINFDTMIEKGIEEMKLKVISFDKKE